LFLSEEQSKIVDLRVTSPDVLYVCKKCGAEERHVYMGKLGEKLMREQICHDCHHVERFLKLTKSPRLLIFGGEIYFIGNRVTGSDFRGFGGALWHFRRLDTGEEIWTKNLWYNGKVPERLKDQLPDNVEQVTQEGMSFKEIDKVPLYENTHDDFNLWKWEKENEE
jgi:hypothetical protein